MVLGERDKAQAAAAEARRALASDPESFAKSTTWSKAWDSKDEQERMTRKQRRLILIGSSLGVLAIAAALVLNSLSVSIVFFNSPTDIAEKHMAVGTRIRVGGLVKPGSVQRGENLNIRFEVTDGKSDVPVRYQGIVPDLFRDCLLYTSDAADD